MRVFGGVFFFFCFCSVLGWLFFWFVFFKVKTENEELMVELHCGKTVGI